MKVYLKFQIELFFKGLITHILENKLAPLIHQELALEMIVELCTEPSFITSLYINFDCDLYCSNTLEILCRYMYKVTISYYFLKQLVYYFFLFQLECFSC